MRVFDNAFLEVKDVEDSETPDVSLAKMNVWMLNNPKME